METNDADVTDIVEQAAELVLRAAAGEAGAEEELAEFAARSSQHLKYILLNIAIHQELAELGDELQARGSQQRPKSDNSDEVLKRFPQGRLVFISILAVIALGLGTLFGLSEHCQLLIAFPGHVRSLRLSDGSFLQLNGGAVARPDVNGSGRSVTLWNGEAFFDVERDLMRPFTVKAGKTIVRALGTTFDVRVLSSNVTVTVKEGRVEVERDCEQSPSASGEPMPARNGTVILEAGQQASVSADGCIRRKQTLDAGELERELAWSGPLLEFKGEPLKNVVNQFNRYNRRQLFIRDSAILDVRVDGRFDSKDLDFFMAALESLGVQAVFQPVGPAGGNEILLAGSNCRWNGVRCTN